MNYKIQAKDTGLVFGTFEGETPEEAIAAWLLSRGISSDCALTIARALEGVTATSTVEAAIRYFDDLADRYASLGCLTHANVAAARSGGLRGAEFRRREAL